MIKYYKYRLFLTPEQETEFDVQVSGARFVYNLALETKLAAWNGYRKNLSFFDLGKQMTELKNSEEGKFLKKIHSQVLQSSLKNLDNAFNQFFKGRGFPNFKSRKTSKESIQFPQEVSVDFDNNIIKLPKFKQVTCIFSRKFTGTIKTCTMSKSASGKYYISIIVDTSLSFPTKASIQNITTIGIDMGVKTFATLSDNTSFPGIKSLKENLSRLKLEQRKLNRKFKKGVKEQSSGYYKQKLVVTKLHEHITNKRQDYLHKVSTLITKRYDTIILEDLNIQKMKTSMGLLVSDIGWNSFEQMLKYKCDWYGKNLIYINRFEPTSKTCSICGTINQNLTLADRTWTCSCGITHDRDLNAAINIKNIGLRMQSLEVKTRH